MSRKEKILEFTEDIVSKFDRLGIKVDPNSVRRRLEMLIFDFKVPENEAYRTVINYLIKEHDVSRERLVLRESPIVKIEDIVRPDVWVSVKAKVLQLWDPTSPNVSQVGLIGDETGIIKFVVWSKAEKKDVEEGKCYLFKNVVTDSFGGRLQINVNRNSEIIEIDENIKPPEMDVKAVGALVAIQQNSGLIQRCKICKRATSKGMCPIHGKTETYDDLRIKGVIDDGENIYEIILNEDNIKNLVGIDLEMARKIAEDNLDRNSVLVELKSKLLGRYLEIYGTKGGRYLLVKDVKFLEKSEIEKKVNELLTTI